MNYWLIKSEPSTYSWDDLVADKKTCWSGIRNYAARLNLRAMQKGDICLFYHSNIGKEIVGMAEVVKTAYPDPTSDDPQWEAVDVKAKSKVKTAVSLETMKKTKGLENLELIRISRLSVCKVTPEQFEIIMALSQ